MGLGNDKERNDTEESLLDSNSPSNYDEQHPVSTVTTAAKKISTKRFFHGNFGAFTTWARTVSSLTLGGLIAS